MAHFAIYGFLSLYLDALGYSKAMIGTLWAVSVLVDWLQEAGRNQAAGSVAGVVLNAGAYTHTSVALHDAIKGAGVTLIELHISNVHAREAFRHHSYISPAAKAVMAGFGVQGYPLAIAGLAALAGL